MNADSTNHYKNPSRRGWQVSEHDGLLGSGLFPRTSGYAPGASAPKFQPSDNYQLNRTKEPYHPPRPYKVTKNYCPFKYIFLHNFHLLGEVRIILLILCTPGCI